MLLQKQNLLLPPPFTPTLDNEAIYHYRMDYRQYRAGEAKGSTGEVATVASTHHVYDEVDSDGTFLVWDDTFSGTNESYEDMVDSELFKRVSDFRLLYRNFRKGKARGAEGEIGEMTKRLGPQHLQILPVWQLCEYLRSRGPSETTVCHPSSPLKCLHVHMGFGKLSCGLILGSLLKSLSPFVILQRYTSEFVDILDRKKNSNSGVLPVYMNGQLLCKLLVVGPDTSTIPPGLLRFLNSGIWKEIDTADSPYPVPIEDTSCMKCGYFVCTDNKPITAQILNAATSLSCSVGGDIDSRIRPYLRTIIPKHPRVRLFACENDHHAISNLAHKHANRVEVIPCMVDRICAERTVLSDRIEGVSEPYEGVILVNPPDRKVSPDEVWSVPFYGSIVVAPRLKSQADYLSQRKIIIVNGLHTTLAFLTLCAKHQSGPLVSYEILNSKSMSDEEKRTLWVWGVARCLLVLWEHDVCVIKATHAVTEDLEVVNVLLDYVRTTINRFDFVVDYTARVLGGGVQNRYQTRLRNVYDFFNDQDVGSIPLGRLVLREAGVGNIEFGFILHSLIEKARRFVVVSEGSEEKNSAVPSRVRNVLGISNPLAVLRKLFAS